MPPAKKKKPVAAKKKKVASVKAAKKKTSAQKVSKAAGLVWEKASVADAVAAVLTHLQAGNVQAVLVGASCAALHIPSLKPKSIDLVVREYHVLEMTKLMKELGYKEVELRSFVSLRSPYAIHFFPAPVSVGDAQVYQFKMYKHRSYHFPMLNETDCVRHRLSQWYHWGEEDALRDALMLSKKFKVDQVLIQRWSEQEWAKEKYVEFARLLKEQK